MSAEVFVSYSQPDRECAFELTECIESGGKQVWIAPRDISPCADWAEEIVAAISAVRVMVLVFSAHSNDSPQVRREVERAVHKRVPILPFRIQDALPCGSLEYFLSSQHWLDAFPPPRAPHYARLCATLGTMLAAPACAPRPQDPAARATSPAVNPPHFAPIRLEGARLRELELHLAHYIGPIAPYLVRRALGHATDFTDLVNQLGAELERAADRRQFIESCRQL
jgi:TIR domain